MIMTFIFFLLFAWFLRLAVLAADDFVGALSNKKRILTVIEIILFFTIVFFTVNNRFNIEKLLLNSIQ